MDWTLTPETDWQAALDNPGYDALVVVAPGTATGLSVAQATWQPLEARRSQATSPAVPGQPGPAVREQPGPAVRVKLGLFAPGLTVDATWSQALEQGRCLARDLAGTEPEAMPPGQRAPCSWSARQ
ncbi:MAG: hypothetical protein RIC38_14470 [Chromatocurvus sp.]